MSNEDRIKELKEELTALETEKAKEEKEERKKARARGNWFKRTLTYRNGFYTALLVAFSLAINAMEVRNDLPDLVEIINAYEDSLNAVELNLIQIATQLNAYEDSLNAVQPSATEIQAITAPLYRRIERNENQIEEAMVGLDGVVDLSFSYIEVVESIIAEDGGLYDFDDDVITMALFSALESLGFTKRRCLYIFQIYEGFEKKHYKEERTTVSWKRINTQ